MQVQWTQLASKGFLHLPGFLSAGECQAIQRDYASEAVQGQPNGNYDVKVAHLSLSLRFERRLKEVAGLVRAATDINADTPSGALYFATRRGIAFSWHQDHESFFLLQEHYHYLNFYIPIMKQQKKCANLCVIPFDVLKLRAPDHYERLIGAGANRFEPDGKHTLVHSDEYGIEYELPVNLETLSECPELAEGDLLLLRGDVIHRTQDTASDRVAISFRRQSSQSLVSKDRLLAGGSVKRRMIGHNAADYQLVLDCFAEKSANALRAGEVLSYLKTRYLARAYGSTRAHGST